MHSQLFLFFFLFASSSISSMLLVAQPMTLKVRKDDSHIGFSIYKWAVIKEEGRFRDFDGTIQYDPRKPLSTQVQFTIRAASIDSRNESRDDALRSEEFFHVTKYPTLSFSSTGILSAQDGILNVEGDLTIRGIKKRVTIPVKVLGVTNAGSELGTLVGFESTFVINREDFRVGEGWGVIGKEATIHLLIGAGSGNVASR
ncbi:MAG: YceI family protein [Bacteroidota bacterium]